MKGLVTHELKANSGIGHELDPWSIAKSATQANTASVPVRDDRFGCARQWKEILASFIVPSSPTPGTLEQVNALLVTCLVKVVDALMTNAEDARF
jgi:hypothetical protein